MTSLIYNYSEDFVIVAMDSMCHEGGTMKPLSHLTKFFILPSINGIICGTGLLDVILLWHFYLQKSNVTTSIKGIDNFATEKLREIFKPFRDAYQNLTTTLYHFGYDSDSDKFLAYAYRSEKNFESEQITPTMGIKPEFPGIRDFFDEEFNEEWLVKMVTKQKEYDESLPLEERVGIGGQIHIAILTRDGITAKTIYEFPDFHEIFRTSHNS
jgi:hypothetical protein